MNNESEAKWKRLERDWEVMVSAAPNLISHFMKDGLKWSFVQVHSDCGYIGMDAWRYFIIQGRGLVKDNWILVDFGQEWTIKLEGRHTCREMKGTVHSHKANTSVSIIMDVQLNALSTQNHIRSVAPKPLFFNHGTSRSSRYLLPIMPLMPVSSIFCYKWCIPTCPFACNSQLL